MAGAQQMDAVSSFTHLTENIPSWLSQLAELTKHVSGKNAEFVAEYVKIVNNARPTRIKSPSSASIHSDKEKAIHLSQIDHQNPDPQSKSTHSRQAPNTYTDKLRKNASQMALFPQGPPDPRNSEASTR
jgi:hypothetical protein